MNLNNSYFVYMLECSDLTVYTGISNNYIKRIKNHNNKKGAKYTKNRTPVRLIALFEVKNKSIALSMEHYIKNLKSKKFLLIKDLEFIKNKNLLINESYKKQMIEIENELVTKFQAKRIK